MELVGYDIPADSLFTITIPASAEILSVARRGGRLFALVDPEAPPAPHTFRRVSLGQRVGDDLRYIGTYLDEFDTPMFLFEVVEGGGAA